MSKRISILRYIKAKLFVMILVNMFNISSLMLVKKQWFWVMLIVCSTFFKWRLLKTWVNIMKLQNSPASLYHSSQSSNKKNRFLLESRKLRMFFVVLCSFPYRAWHLNNVRVPLVSISLCWLQRPDNSVVKSVVDLSFFISPPFIKPVSEWIIMCRPKRWQKVYRC